MKPNKIVLFAAAVFGLCVLSLRAEPPPPPGSSSTTTTTTTTETSPGIWTTVPNDYEGDYFLYDGHYYHGGKWEAGDYTWEGRHYTGRYSHEGKFIYGGKWEHHHRDKK